MGGEHFSSATGEDLDKKKDAYVRFRWETKKGEKRPKQTILERAKVLENMEFGMWVEEQYPKKSDVCVCCRKPPAWPLLQFEFYNWKAANTEKEVFAHVECIKTMWPKMASALDALRLLGKNPLFQIQLNCLSILKCRFTKKATDFRNCQHVVLRFDQVHEDNHDGTVSVHMRPVLYCKRAHPGEYFLETEDETWWNVQEAGMAVMVNRVAEMFNTLQGHVDIQAFKAQNSTLIAELRRMSVANNPLFTLLSPQFSIIASLLMEPTPEEDWEEIQKGNDVY
jgi:hypothetical protein